MQPVVETQEARAAAELAARASYGRLVALLARQWHDLAAAEDALADAFRAALETWPETGVPARPEAWLLIAARRVLLDRARAGKVRADAMPTLALLSDGSAMAEPALFPDERLKLLFVCAHPAIDPAARTPLMLQTVLGLDATRIAGAFLTSAATLGQRLVRAKTKIRDAGIPFVVPERSELPERLDAVLQAIYAAYGSGWEDVTGADPKRRGLAQEAIWLARLVTRLLPQEAEAHGLLALMLHCEARRDARRDGEGGFVPLGEQDTALWSRELASEAERALGDASRLGRLGPFQLEAAIQSVHYGRAATGQIDWLALAQLYEALARLAPTIGALVSRAAACANAFGPDHGLTQLDALPQDAIRAYQPYWALRAHLLAKTDAAGADAAFDRAIGLSDDPAVRSFLLRRRNRKPG